MARHFPGRPGLYAGKSRIPIQDDIHKLHDRSTQLISYYRKGIANFSQLFGESDEEQNNFEGFTATDTARCKKHIRRLDVQVKRLRIHLLRLNKRLKTKYIKPPSTYNALVDTAKVIHKQKHTANSDLLQNIGTNSGAKRQKIVKTKHYEEITKKNTKENRQNKSVKFQNKTKQLSNKIIRSSKKSSPNLKKAKQDAKSSNKISTETRKANKITPNKSAKESIKTLSTAKKLLQKAKQGKTTSPPEVEKRKYSLYNPRKFTPPSQSRSCRLITPRKRFIEDDINRSPASKKAPPNKLTQGLIKNKRESVSRTKLKALNSDLPISAKSVTKTEPDNKRLNSRRSIVSSSGNSKATLVQAYLAKKRKKVLFKQEEVLDVINGESPPKSTPIVPIPKAWIKPGYAVVIEPPTAALYDKPAKIVDGKRDRRMSKTLLLKMAEGVETCRRTPTKSHLDLKDQNTMTKKLRQRKENVCTQSGKNILRKAKLHLNKAAMQRSKIELVKSLKLEMDKEGSGTCGICSDQQGSPSTTLFGVFICSACRRYYYHVYSKGIKGQCQFDGTCEIEKHNGLWVTGCPPCGPCRSRRYSEVFRKGIKQIKEGSIAKRTDKNKAAMENCTICCRKLSRPIVINDVRSCPACARFWQYNINKQLECALKGKCKVKWLNGEWIEYCKSCRLGKWRRLVEVEPPKVDSPQYKSARLLKRIALREERKAKEQEVVSQEITEVQPYEDCSTVLSEVDESCEDEAVPNLPSSPDCSRTSSPRVGGPRIKHVSRRSSVVLGLSPARFSLKIEPVLSALPVQEKRKICEREETEKKVATEQSSDEEPIQSDVIWKDDKDEDRPPPEDIDSDYQTSQKPKSSPRKEKEDILYIKSMVTSEGNKLKVKYIKGKHGTIMKRIRAARCGKCDGCMAINCTVCVFCKDMVKYGGVGRLKKACIDRICLNPTDTIKPKLLKTLKGLSKKKYAKHIKLQGSPALSESSTSAKGDHQYSSVKKAVALKEARLDLMQRLGTTKELISTAKASGLSSVLVKESKQLCQYYTAGHVKQRLAAVTKVKQRRIFGDFVEDYDIDIGWDRGIALISSTSLCVRTVCFLCGSAGRHQLIFCNVCCEPFHSFCLEEHERPADGQLENWCCRMCQFCYVCGYTFKRKQILKCERCTQTFHQECIGLNHPIKPMGSKKIWVCTKCVKCRSCGATTPGDTPGATWLSDFTLCYSCGVNMKKGNFCPVCQKCYSDDDWDSKMVQCGKCNSWVHSNCENLSDEMYEILGYLPDDVVYTCRKCSDASSHTWKKAVYDMLQNGFWAVLSSITNVKSSQHLKSREVMTSYKKVKRKSNEAHEKQSPKSITNSSSSKSEIRECSLQNHQANDPLREPKIKSIESTCAISAECQSNNSNSHMTDSKGVQSTKANSLEQQSIHSVPSETTTTKSYTSTCTLRPTRRTRSHVIVHNVNTPKINDLSRMVEECDTDGPISVVDLNNSKDLEEISGVSRSANVSEQSIHLNPSETTTTKSYTSTCTLRPTRRTRSQVIGHHVNTQKINDLNQMVEECNTDGPISIVDKNNSKDLEEASAISEVSRSAKDSEISNFAKNVINNEFPMKISSESLMIISGNVPSTSVVENVSAEDIQCSDVSVSTGVTMSGDSSEILTETMNKVVGSATNTVNTITSKSDTVEPLSELLTGTVNKAVSSAVVLVTTNTLDRPTSTSGTVEALDMNASKIVSICDGATELIGAINTVDTNTSTSIKITGTETVLPGGTNMDVNMSDKLRNSLDKANSSVIALKEHIVSPSRLNQNLAEDLNGIKKKLNEGKYKSVEEFSNDLVNVIQMALYEEEDYPLYIKKANNAVRSIFVKQMAHVFPWYNVNHSRLWDHNRNLPSNMLTNAVLPPSDEHTYAQWLIREEKITSPQPSPFKPTFTKKFNTPVKRNEYSSYLYGDTANDDRRKCAFCGEEGDGLPNECGRLLYAGQDDWVHVNCALWSAEVYEEVDGSLQCVPKALTRGNRLICGNATNDGCGKRGATVGCNTRGCPANYHFMCARAINCVFQEDKKVFCCEHAHCANSSELLSANKFIIQRRMCVDLNDARSNKRNWQNGLVSNTISVLIGSMTVEKLGTLIPQLSDHRDVLYPVGFSCTRVYWSTKELGKRCIYTFTIKEVNPKVNEEVTTEIIRDTTIVHDVTRGDYDAETGELVDLNELLIPRKLSIKNTDTTTIENLVDMRDDTSSTLSADEPISSRLKDFESIPSNVPGEPDFTDDNLSQPDEMMQNLSASTSTILSGLESAQNDTLVNFEVDEETEARLTLLMSQEQFDTNTAHTADKTNDDIEDSSLSAECSDNDKTIDCDPIQSYNDITKHDIQHAGTSMKSITPLSIIISDDCDQVKSDNVFPLDLEERSKLVPSIFLPSSSPGPSGLRSRSQSFSSSDTDSDELIDDTVMAPEEYTTEIDSNTEQLTMGTCSSSTKQKLKLKILQRANSCPNVYTTDTSSLPPLTCRVDQAPHTGGVYSQNIFLNDDQNTKLVQEACKKGPLKLVKKSKPPEVPLLGSSVDDISFEEPDTTVNYSKSVTISDVTVSNTNKGTKSQESNASQEPLKEQNECERQTNSLPNSSSCSIAKNKLNCLDILSENEHETNHDSLGIVAEERQIETDEMQSKNTFDDTVNIINTIDSDVVTADLEVETHKNSNLDSDNFENTVNKKSVTDSIFTVETQQTAFDDATNISNQCIVNDIDETVTDDVFSEKENEISKIKIVPTQDNKQEDDNIPEQEVKLKSYPLRRTPFRCAEKFDKRENSDKRNRKSSDIVCKDAKVMVRQLTPRKVRKLSTELRQPESRTKKADDLRSKSNFPTIDGKVVKSSENLVCQFCQDTFRYKRALLKHEKDCTARRPTSPERTNSETCLHCKKQFRSLSLRSQHEEFCPMISNDKLTCKECGKEFKFVVSLVKHVANCEGKSHVKSDNDKTPKKKLQSPKFKQKSPSTNSLTDKQNNIVSKTTEQNQSPSCSRSRHGRVIKKVIDLDNAMNDLDTSEDDVTVAEYDTSADFHPDANEPTDDETEKQKERIMSDTDSEVVKNDSEEMLSDNIDDSGSSSKPKNYTNTDVHECMSSKKGKLVDGPDDIHTKRYPYAAVSVSVSALLKQETPISPVLTPPSTSKEDVYSPCKLPVNKNATTEDVEPGKQSLDLYMLKDKINQTFQKRNTVEMLLHTIVKETEEVGGADSILINPHTGTSSLVSSVSPTWKNMKCGDLVQYAGKIKYNPDKPFVVNVSVKKKMAEGKGNKIGNTRVLPSMLKKVSPKSDTTSKERPSTTDQKSCTSTCTETPTHYTNLSEALIALAKKNQPKEANDIAGKDKSTSDTVLSLQTGLVKTECAGLSTQSPKKVCVPTNTTLDVLAEKRSTEEGTTIGDTMVDKQTNISQRSISNPSSVNLASIKKDEIQAFITEQSRNMLGEKRVIARQTPSKVLTQATFQVKPDFLQHFSATTVSNNVTRYTFASSPTFAILGSQRAHTKLPLVAAASVRPTIRIMSSPHIVDNIPVVSSQVTQNAVYKILPQPIVNTPMICQYPTSQVQPYMIQSQLFRPTYINCLPPTAQSDNMSITRQLTDGTFNIGQQQQQQNASQAAVKTPSLMPRLINNQVMMLPHFGSSYGNMRPTICETLSRPRKRKIQMSKVRSPKRKVWKGNEHKPHTPVMCSVIKRKLSTDNSQQREAAALSSANDPSSENTVSCAETLSNVISISSPSKSSSVCLRDMLTQPCKNSFPDDSSKRTIRKKKNEKIAVKKAISVKKVKKEKKVKRQKQPEDIKNNSEGNISHPLLHPGVASLHLPEPVVEEEVTATQIDLDTDSVVGSGRRENVPYLVFEITSDDGFYTQSESLNDAWKVVVDSVSDLRAMARLKQLAYGGVDGLRMFCLKHDAILYLLEQLYGAESCKKYHFKFHEYDFSLYEEEPPINDSGCARSEDFKSRKPWDMFAFLMSKYRILPPVIGSQQESKPGTDTMLKSTRRATSLDLPMAMRYRHLREHAREAVGVYRSRIHGRGLFCKRDIDAGEMVIEYTGEVIRAVLTDKREKYYESKGIGCYMFRIDDYDVVDATMHGSGARFINHACEPNCYSKVIDVNNLKHIVIFALRQIKRGEELTYDYKFPFEEVKIPCTCGAKRCRKYLN